MKSMPPKFKFFNHVIFSCFYLLNVNILASDLNEHKPKKYLKLSTEQRYTLRKYYKIQPKPTKDEIEDISQELNLPFKKVKNWFSNEKQRKKRVNKKKFTDKQYKILEKEFNKNHYPEQKEIKNISFKTGLKIKQVQTYFSNQRGRNHISRGRFNKEQREILSNFLLKNIAHPYPTEQEKQDLSKKTGLSITQINSWFINSRRRYLKKNNPNTILSSYKNKKRKREDDHLPPAKKIKKEENNSKNVDIEDIDSLYDNKDWFLDLFDPN